MTEQRAILRPALMLGALGLAAALLLAGLNRLTEDRIAAERQQRALGAVSAMLEPRSHDNDLLADQITLRIDGLPEPARVFRARTDGEARAAVFDVTTRQGYSGPIRLLVAVDAGGRILGVRVLDHRETPGLGDKIEREKSDWIEQFSDRSLGRPPPEAWASDRRGGEFDTLTSATVTSSAVIQTVRAVLETHRRRTDAVYAPADGPAAGGP